MSFNQNSKLTLLVHKINCRSCLGQQTLSPNKKLSYSMENYPEAKILSGNTTALILVVFSTDKEE